MYSNVNCFEPDLDDDDFSIAVHTAQKAYDDGQPGVVVGLSRGGAVAMNIDIGETPLVLMCPGWKRWGKAMTVRKNTVILHSRADDLVPFSYSEELVKNSGLPPEALIDIGNDHWLSDPEPLRRSKGDGRKLPCGDAAHFLRGLPRDRRLCCNRSRVADWLTQCSPA